MFTAKGELEEDKIEMDHGPTEDGPEDNRSEVLRTTEEEKLRIELSKDNVRELQSFKNTSFWDSEGRPITAKQFVKLLFQDLPNIFKSEEHTNRFFNSAKIIGIDIHKINLEEKKLNRKNIYNSNEMD